MTVYKKAAGLLAAAGVMTGLLLATAAPAQAHEGAVDISRNGCGYWGYSNHNYAETYKSSGSCSGHAWLRVRINGVIGSWSHAAGEVHVYAPSGMSIQVSDHKSCADCGYKTVWHI
ncbi:hypothetical protein [Streptomyces sp. NPDC056921]|uniref:hypothetical protein n=1 Tax=Streptomyces sp. NPDC056921 TaxID=3345966 RepID=UPI003640F320